MTQSELREKINDAVWCSDDRERNDMVESLIREVVEFAIDETKGYYTDVEYVTGKSKEEFIKELFG